MAKVDVNAERAARLVEALKGQRDQGTDYPLTAARLRERVEPTLSDDDLFKALGHKSQADNLVVAAKKDLASPIALAEDAAKLAGSDLLLEYALGKLATADKPLHPVARVVGKVDKRLQPAFEAALTERLSTGQLPPGVGRREVKGQVQLYLEKFPPPPPPAPKKSATAVLAEQLLANLNARRQQGETVVALAELAGADVKPALVKKATEEEPFRSQAVVVPVGKTLTLAAPADQRDALLGNDALLRALLEARTSAKNPFATLAELAGGLPEEYREAFTAAWGGRLEANTLPAGVLLHDGALSLASFFPWLRVLADRAVASLERRRLAGTGYPTTLQTLLQADVPGTSDDLVAKLAADRDFRSRVVLAVPGEPRAPLALPGDEELLASSPLLIEYAVRLVSTPEQPLHPVNKVAGALDRPLRKPFEQAVARLAGSGEVPAGVAVHEVKGKLHLRRADLPLPPPPEERLAGKLLSALRAARAAGTDYPLSLAQLIERADPAAPERLVKQALAQGAFTGHALTALPGRRDSLVALSEDRDRLAADVRLLEQTLAGARSADNQAVAAADLGKKLAPDLRATFTAAVQDRVSGHTLPAGIGCLVLRKKPHLFLLADLDVRLPEKATPAEEVEEEIDFARMFEDAFAKLEPAGHGLVSLVDLRQQVPVERERFDRELEQLRRAGHYSLQGAEGRHGISPQERAAGIAEHGDLLLYVSRREV